MFANIRYVGVPIHNFVKNNHKKLITMEKLIDWYLDYVNNFITVERFAEWHGLEIEDAEVIIELGRKYHLQKTA